MRLTQPNYAATLEAVRQLSETDITQPARKNITIPVVKLNIPRAPEPPEIAYLKVRQAWAPKTPSMA